MKLFPFSILSVCRQSFLSRRPTRLEQSSHKCSLYQSMYSVRKLIKTVNSSLRILDLNSCFNTIRRPSSIFYVRRLKFVIFTLHYSRAVYESWLSSLESSPELHVPSLKSLLFPGAESRVESRVISLESESSQVIAKVSRVIIAHLVVST